MAIEHRVNLAPPPLLVDSAKAVMGAIDFDPWSTKDINKLVGAARFLDRDQHDLDTTLAMDWDLPGQKRAFIAPAHGAQWTRRLCNKALREYRKARLTKPFSGLRTTKASRNCHGFGSSLSAFRLSDCALVTSTTNLRPSGTSRHQHGLRLFTFRQLTRKTFIQSFPFSQRVLPHRTSYL